MKNIIAIAAPQWRISTNRREASRIAMAAGADRLHLDFGGAHRGPPLSDPLELREAEEVAKAIPVPVLAVNHINDIGLAKEQGSVNPAAVALLYEALNCGRHLGVRVLHVPGFRLSRPATVDLRAGTIRALQALCERASEADITVAYESPLNSCDSLALANAVDHPVFRLVLDTGNLMEVGEDPLEFARDVESHRLLLPDLHIKEPAQDSSGHTATRRTAFALLPSLLRHASIRSVLVENDYRQDPTLLHSDVTYCRSTLAVSDRKESQ